MNSLEGHRQIPINELEAERHGREVGHDDGFMEGREIGHVEGLQLALTALYEARYGGVPSRIREAIGSQAVLTELVRWNTLLGSRPREVAERVILGLDG